MKCPPQVHTFEHLVPSCIPFWEVVKPCGIVLAGRRKTLDVGLWSLASNGASFSVSLPATVASRSCWWKWRHALSSRMDWCSWKQMPKQALPLLSCFCRYFVLVMRKVTNTLWKHYFFRIFEIIVLLFFSFLSFFKTSHVSIHVLYQLHDFFCFNYYIYMYMCLNIYIE